MKKRIAPPAYWVLLLLFAVAASRGSVPPGTSIDNQASASYTAASGSSTTAGSNVVHVITQAGVAALAITKSASETSAKPGDHIAFTLTINNSGNADAAGAAVTIDGAATTRVVASDAIANNTRFFAIVNAGGATPLYHIFGSPAQTYVSAAPADVSTIDAVAFALNSLAAGASATFSFSVAVDSNATGNIHNIAQVFFNNGSDTSAVSNAVDIPVSGPPPAIAYYFDNTFSRVIHASAVGSPLYLQLDAAACNLDPLTAETKVITLKSTLTGDTETFTATETGPNTGVFRILPPVPTRDGSTNPVVSGNKIMEVLRNDQIVATMSGCGATSVTATVLIDPLGIVFDSSSNVNIAGATVTLIDVTGNGNGGHPNAPATVLQFDGVTPAPSTVTTSSNGQFQFPQVLPSTYQISVKPPSTYTFPSKLAPAQLPPGRHIDPSASYNGSFVVLANSGIVLFDVPVDAAPSTQLFVQKTAAQTQVEVGDFIDYTVEIKNLLSTPLPNVQVTDTLPPGFVYQTHSARLNGVPITDPPGKGPVLTFSIGTLAANADVKLTYRVLAGPGSNIGDNVNRASASSGGSQSNTSSVHVLVQGGVFSDKGFIVGKVFQDCNGNRMQDAGEMGIPGVRIYLEDGTFAITDGEGKYSIYGVASRLHILKVDSYSLPHGANLVALSNRNGGDGSSRFIDLRFGEMQKADFAISNCTAAMAEEIASRKKQVTGDQEVARAVKAQFNAQEIQKDSTQLKAMSASGFVDARPTPQPGAGGPHADLASDKGLPASASEKNLAAEKTLPAGESGSAPAPLASANSAPAVDLARLSNQLGFVDLHNNDVLPFAQTNIRIKGMAGNNFKLLVNGKEAPAKEVGAKSVIADTRTEVWEFVGVNLQPGRNSIQVTQFDPYGNARGSEKIELIAPSKLGKLKISADGRKLYPADGKTPVKLVVRLTDSADIPVTVRTPVTLEATNGTWLVKDLNPKEPGTQTFIEGGQAEYMLMPPSQAGPSTVRVTSGSVSAETRIEFVPELRPMMAAGVAEYQLNFGGLAHNSTQPSLNDSFEQQLNLFSAQNGNDSFRSAGHAALLLKGEIKGSNLLTLAYDSDKTTRSQLFRDIQPDQFYPVYGDASVRGYDAQSTSKAYLRIDHGQSYIVYGDYLTTDPGTNNSLSNYSRSMTGVKTHFANDRFNLTGFASYDSLTQVVDELLANGTSGPFVLSNPNGVENSEKVEILTRDRNQPSVILDIRQLTRFADYEFEPFTGELLLKAPLPSLDSNLNPQSIRVTYEVNSGGPRFWTGGGMAQVKLNKFMQIGGTLVNDTNPQDPMKLFAFMSNIALQKKTIMSAEFAGTDHSLLQGIGLGYRFVVEHDGDKLKGKAYFSRTDQDFNNPTSILNQGRGESGFKGSYALNKSTRLLGEFIRSEDVTSGGVQQGGELALEKSLPGNILTRFGFRHSDETLNPANTADAGVTPNTVNALETKVSMPIPHFNKLTATAEYEQDVSDPDKRVVAVGGSYQFWDRGRFYVRHELISSLGNVYSLNTLQGRSTTQIGVDTTYFKDAHVFSEYRIRDDLNGRDAEAAIGLRNNWHIAKGLTANTGIEDVKTLNGIRVDSLALVGALEYTAHENWKASARMEWRGSTSSDTILNTLGFAARLSDSWTFLGRNILSDTKNKGSAISRQIQDRMQVGFALRDYLRNRWNALTMVEFKNQNDNTNPLTPVKSKLGIFSATANYQVTAPFTVSGRYAAKWNLDTGNGLSSTATTQMLAGRAMWDLTHRWDIGFATSTLYSLSTNSRQYGLGPEIGYQLMPNVWVSSGYNVVGFKDNDLSGEDVTRRGAFLRLRFKFDESLFLRKEQPK